MPKNRTNITESARLSATCYIATSMTSVRLSVCLSVTLVHCVHIVQRKRKSAHDRYVDVFATVPACQSRPGSHSQYPVIPNSTEEDHWGVGKCGVLHFGGNNLRYGATHALDRYRTLIWEITFGGSNGTICWRLRISEVREIVFVTVNS